MIAIALAATGESAVIRLTGYLGSERFARYRAVCQEHGASWDAGARLNRAPLTAIAGLVTGFVAAGLPVVVDPAVTDRLRGQAEAAQQDLEIGRARVEACRDRLARQGLRLYRYQETGIEWLAPRKRALLADEMGLGKTPQALLALPDHAAALAVVPGAVRYSWVAETRRWRPDLRPVVVQTSSEFRFPRSGEILIATYGVLPSHEEQTDADASDEAEAAGTMFGSSPRRKPTHLGQYGLPREPLCLVVDEAHLVKTSRALRTKRVRALAKIAEISEGRVWLLTGTPLLNRESELWAVLETAGLGKEAFGSYPQFVRAMTRSEEAALALRRVALRRRKDEVLTDLPPKTRQDVGVLLDAKTAALCDELKAALLASGKTVDDLLGAVNEPIIFEMIARVRAAVCAAKIPVLLELVEEYEEQEKPLVVFAAHRAPVDTLAVRRGWAAITGDTPVDERGRIVERFQAGELRGVALTIAAGGVGITLTRASDMIMVDLAWSPASNVQAEDRLRRIGQKSAVLVKRLIAAHEIDERVCQLLTQKQEIIERTVEASAVEADHVAPSPSEQLVEAVKAAAAVPLEDVEALMAKTREAEAAQRRADEETLRQEVARIGDGREVSIDGRQRAAANAIEDWAAQGLILLASMDRDRARIINEAGFSKYDNDFGHSLATQLRRSGKLSAKQWASAVKLANRYRRQIGAAPQADAKQQ